MLVAEVAGLWGVDTGGAGLLVEGAGAVVRLPAAGAVVHIGRAELGSPRIEALHRARARLAECSIPVVELMRSLFGSSWHWCQGRVVEVERWVEHDARMTGGARLLTGCSLLADIHTAWSTLDLGPEGEACTWANWVSADAVASQCESAGPRLRGWGLGRLADDIVRLAALTADHRVLPTQVVHGDFWDDNVYLRGHQVVAVTDFDFLGRRPRIDDLALLLHFADEQPYFEGAGKRSARARREELAPLVHAYADQLVAPLTDHEMAALPLSLARQPLWNYGTRLMAQKDDVHARRDAQDAAPSVARALDIMTEPDRWIEAFTSS